MALVNGGLLAQYRHDGILKKSSSQKLLVRFLNNFYRNVPWVTRLKKTLTKF